jgi:hypothetical protein
VLTVPRCEPQLVADRGQLERLRPLCAGPDVGDPPRAGRGAVTAPQLDTGCANDERQDERGAEMTNALPICAPVARFLDASSSSPDRK